ncbi:hypothetical protein GMORB2_0695 [Geosmithia morbida]|uniref:Uncharacterized protein n=1 Tax=Geosmithia morbida TaxID=1094350 RepID=A0A9P4Z483_9HYPO|nr:uncharacterized protein GMORB2_0695 [Geosmithia morbida]KAF4126958.1 hypothetical protein GMORB2_0695 [Geosmithia morbida]
MIPVTARCLTLLRAAAWSACEVTGIGKPPGVRPLRDDGCTGEGKEQSWLLIQ